MLAFVLTLEPVFSPKFVLFQDACDVCGGLVLDNLTTVNASSTARAVVSMASRDSDLRAWFTLAHSLRTTGDFDGSIILLWFGKREALMLCKLQPVVERLRLTVVCVFKPLAKREIHASVTGRSWDWVKLLSFTLTQFKEVIFLDADIIAVNRVDHLFSVPDGKDFMFTSGPYDLLNSGFFVFFPSLSHYAALIHLVRTGNYSKRDGWNHAGIVEGRNNHWNECQGLLYHYFMQVRNTGVEWEPSPIVSPALSVSRNRVNTTGVHFLGQHKPCPIANMKTKAPMDKEMWSSWPYTAWEESFGAVFGDEGFKATRCSWHIKTVHR